MHLLLTDRLTCPRCGPAFGLILRADAMQGRRVVEGGLGCANCRQVYPIDRGVADLTGAPRAVAPAGGEEAESDRGAMPPDGSAEGEWGPRLQALLEIERGPAEVALVGEAAALAAALVTAVGDLQAATILPLETGLGHAERGEPDKLPAAGVSPIRVGDRLPFFDRVLRGIVLQGPDAVSWFREAARCLGPGGRVVVLEPPPGTGDLLLAAGLKLRLDSPRAVVAGR